MSELSKKGPGAHMHEMTDREMEAQCARGMNFVLTDDYRPLMNDAQAEALAVRFGLEIGPDPYFPEEIRATLHYQGNRDEPEHIRYATRPTRRRAIVTVIANHMWGRP